MSIKWSVSKADALLIKQIAHRAVAIATKEGVDCPLTDLAMDITAVHANGCPLKLTALAAAPEGDFIHDVFGIRRQIDRSTGQLNNCFLPRYAA